MDHMQIVCTLLQTDNHASTSSPIFFTGRMLFLTPNRQCQSTEGIHHLTAILRLNVRFSWTAIFDHLSPVYTIQPVVKPLVKPDWQPVKFLYTRYNRLSNLLSNRYDKRFDNRFYRVYKHPTSCQTGCTTGCSIVQPVGQPAAPCKLTPVVKPVDNRSDNQLYNRFDNRLYRLNGVLR